MTPHSQLFSIHQDADGPLFESVGGDIRERIWFWNNMVSDDSPDRTTYGFVMSGECKLELEASRHVLGVGCYFSVTGAFTIRGGKGMLIHVPAYLGLNAVGGPIESRGRLRYIDGCTDTLLIPPVKLGDPCLNALYFPRGISQTAHTHPSVRLGGVLSGSGVCKTDLGDYVLESGVCFCLPAGLSHGFHTTSSELVVMAYHPDSDFGPQDENHPMLNRTIVDGVSARALPALHTR